ncbi:UNVERIFIED_CONTAM: hypothetical protein FKN15_002835 [Acipenser sinensis]
MEHPRTLAHHLCNFAVGWLDPGTNSKNRVVELVVLEQFLEALGPVLGLWVQRQGPETLNEAVTMAERYQAAEPAPSSAPYKSAASAPAPHTAPERVKGLGGVDSSHLDGLWLQELSVRELGQGVTELFLSKPLIGPLPPVTSSVPPTKGINPSCREGATSFRDETVMMADATSRLVAIFSFKEPGLREFLNTTYK